MTKRCFLGSVQIVCLYILLSVKVIFKDQPDIEGGVKPENLTKIHQPVVSMDLAINCPMWDSNSKPKGRGLMVTVIIVKI